MCSSAHSVTADWHDMGEAVRTSHCEEKVNLFMICFLSCGTCLDSSRNNCYSSITVLTHLLNSLEDGHFDKFG